MDMDVQLDCTDFLSVKRIYPLTTTEHRHQIHLKIKSDFLEIYLIEINFYTLQTFKLEK